MDADAPWNARFGNWARDLLAQQAVVGAAIAVADGGEAAGMFTYGTRDRDRNLSVTEHTRFGLASVTKSFTAAAIMRLQEAGALAVDDPVARHLPELRLPGLGGARPMRIGHLMSHSSGLPPLPTRRMVFALAGAPEDDRPIDGAGTALVAVDSAQGVIDALSGMDIVPLGQPGEVFSYSNDGYVLLGEIIARLSGVAYEEYVTREILEPAGMTRTTFDAAQATGASDHTRLYAGETGEGGTRHATDAGDWANPRAWLAPGGLSSCVRDMLRYLEIYRTGGTVEGRRILSPESVAAMLAPRIECTYRTWYGYGLSMHDGPDGARRYHHGGGRVGVSSHIVVVPQRALTAVCLTNTSPAPAGQLANGLVNVRLGLEPGTPQTDLPAAAAPSAPLDDYIGEYVSGEGAQVTVDVQGDALSLRTGGERLALTPMGEDAFAAGADGDRTFLRFLRGADGSVDAVSLGLRVVRRTRRTTSGT